MNKCTLSASNARYKDENGRWRYATCRVSGLKTVGTINNCLMPRETAYVTIYIRGVWGKGELGGASVNLSCNYGNGEVSVNDIVW